MNRIFNAVSALGFTALIAVASGGLAHASPTMTVTANSAINGIAPFPAPCGLNGTQTQDCWEPEPGQSIPTGTAGYLNGTVTVNGAGILQITYGGNGLVAGDTGHGNSSFPNDVVFTNSTTNRAQAIANGWVFCTQAGDPDCGGGAATAVGKTISVPITAGLLQFTFDFGPGGANTLADGTQLLANNSGAWLAACGPLSAGPLPASCTSATVYVGLTDSAYTGPAALGDHDFQDLVFTVRGVPEPASVLLLGLGLVGLGLYGRKKFSV